MINHAQLATGYTDAERHALVTMLAGPLTYVGHSADYVGRHGERIARDTLAGLRAANAIAPRPLGRRASGVPRTGVILTWRGRVAAVAIRSTAPSIVPD